MAAVPDRSVVTTVGGCSQNAGKLFAPFLFHIQCQGLSAIEAGLNNFYGDSANLEIPIIDAYQHVSMVLNFAPARELGNNLSNIRQKYTE